MTLDRRDRAGPLDPGEAFQSLEPPAGGLAALRARLAREQQVGRRRLWGPLTSLAAAAAVVALGLSWQAARRPSRLLDDRAMAEHYPGLVALGVAGPPAEPVTALDAEGRPLRLRRLPVSRTEVVIYLTQPPRRSNMAAPP